MTTHERDLPGESESPSQLVGARSGGSDTTRRFTVITSPEPTSVCIPAPRLLVRHLATGTSMGLYPVTAHQLARRVARRWRGSVELLPVEAAPVRGDQSPARGTP
jgi:hypothetical protein